MNVQKSGLTRTVLAIVAVLLVVIAGLGALFVTQKPPQVLTQTATVTATQTVSVTSTVTALQTVSVTSSQTPTPTANNTIDLRANSHVVLAVVGLGANIPKFIIGALANPIIKVKAGTSIQVIFHSEVVQGQVGSSFIITSSKPPFPFNPRQADLTPAFPGASTDNPNAPTKDQFILFFTADKPGIYYYINGVDGGGASLGMYGQFIVEG